MTIEKIELMVKKLKTRKSKNIIYLIVMCFVIAVFAFRFYVVAQEQNRAVFNIMRNNITNGTPVKVLEVQETKGVLYEPLNIKNNRAYVSESRLNLFKPGQSLGDCKIISVSHRIDLDSGMYLIRTKGCTDGLKYAQNEQNGFYVPISAISGNQLYVASDNTAHIREIVVVARDLQNALVKSGLQNGDIVILSNVQQNQKIRIVK